MKATFYSNTVEPISYIIKNIDNAETFFSAVTFHDICVIVLNEKLVINFCVNDDKTVKIIIHHKNGKTISKFHSKVQAMTYLIKCWDTYNESIKEKEPLS